MNQFSIKDIENLCGIRAHTIRIWEQRYKLCVPKRKQSQHRIYSDNDLKELLRVAFLYHNGYKISRIAELDPQQVFKLVEESVFQNHNSENHVHQLIEAGIDFDKERFEKLVNCIVLRTGMERAIIGVFYPFLERLGLLWLTNHVIPAQEHFSSHIIRKKIIVATDGIENNTVNQPRVLIFAPTGEYHEIPLLTANYFLKKNNNQTIYFGTNVSLETLEYYLSSHTCDYLFAHMVTYLHNDNMKDYFAGLCEKFPGKKIVLSGPAIKGVNDDLPNLEIIRSLDEMIRFTTRTERII